MSTDEATWADVLDEVDELIDGNPDTPVWDALVVELGAPDTTVIPTSWPVASEQADPLIDLDAWLAEAVHGLHHAEDHPRAGVRRELHEWLDDDTAGPRIDEAERVVVSHALAALDRIEHPAPDREPAMAIAGFVPADVLDAAHEVCSSMEGHPHPDYIRDRHVPLVALARVPVPLDPADVPAEIHGQVAS